MTAAGNTGAAYDAFSSSYRAYADTRQPYLQSVDALITETVSAPASILDFGAGDGVRGQVLKESLRASNLTQVDISEKMLELCRRRGHAERVLHVDDFHFEHEAGQYDLVLALWNVLGHLENNAARSAAVEKLFSCVKPGGFLIFDVNNRHNIAYGKWRSLFRRALDFCFPDSSRGDTRYEWHIDGKSYPSFGHLFTLAEIKKMLNDTGILQWHFVAIDYANGRRSQHLSQGQLVFICRKAEN